jgi:predicted hotdog family 3-hydroxylacyl-ACP dehydratase
MEASDLPPVLEVLPHRSPVVLLDRLLAHDPAATTVRVAIGENRWLLRPDGSAPPWLALEYMAQCVAAHEGLLARADGRPLPRGFLVRAHGLRMPAPGFASGEVFQVRAARERGRAGLGVLSHRCSVVNEEGDQVAEGRLSVALVPPAAESPAR